MNNCLFVTTFLQNAAKEIKLGIHGIADVPNRLCGGYYDFMHRTGQLLGS